MKADIKDIVLMVPPPGKGKPGKPGNPQEPEEDELAQDYIDKPEGDSPDGEQNGESEESDEKDKGQDGKGKGNSKEVKQQEVLVPSSAFSEEEYTGQTTTVTRKPRTGDVISKEAGRKILQEENEDEVSEPDWEKQGRDLVQKHLHERNGGKGFGKGAIFQRIMELTEPKINWRSELKRLIGKLERESQYKLPNRRYVASGVYRYGLEDKDNALENAVVAMDVSGSIASSFPELAAEVVGIVKAKKIKVVSILPFADTVVTPFQVRGFKKPTPDDFSKVRTGGGTEAIGDVVDWVDTKLKGKLDFLVIMTDGLLTRKPPAPPAWGTKVIWLVFDNPHFSVENSWGRVIHANGDPGYWKR